MDRMDWARGKWDDLCSITDFLSLRPRITSFKASNRAADAFESHLQPEMVSKLPIQHEQIGYGTSLIWRVGETDHAAGVQHDAQAVDIEEQRYRCTSDRKRGAVTYVPGIMAVLWL